MGFGTMRLRGFRLRPCLSAVDRHKVVGLSGLVLLACTLPVLVQALEHPRIREALVAYGRAVHLAAADPFPARAGTGTDKTGSVLAAPPRSVVAFTEMNARGAPGFVSMEWRRPVSAPAGREAQSTPPAAVDTRYCVRLCDGYAFPIGTTGEDDAQEMACRRACPLAQTALYSLPAGLSDIGAARRDGRTYSALPHAFRYRRVYDHACRCTATGSTQAASAILQDFTLRRGDIVMTRLGARYFEGAQQFPYRATAFSDALSRLESAGERAQVRAMEMASLRGVLSPEAHARLRQHMLRAQAERTITRPVMTASGRGFETLRAERPPGLLAMQVSAHKAGWVALN